MKKLKFKLQMFLAGLLSAFDPAPHGAIALSNELGGVFDDGRETLQIDPTDTIPQTLKYLGYMRGSTQYLAKTWDGGAGAGSFPLGISPDAAYQVGDFLDVERLGAVKGSKLGVSSGAITIDHLVCAASGGKVADANTTNATVWIIGRATKTVSAAAQEITFLPCSPYLLTSNGSGTFTNVTNQL